MHRLALAATVSTFGLLAPTTAHAQIHQGDIALGIDGDRMAVGDGSRDSVTGTLIFDECIFGVQFDSNARTTDPGFDTDTGVFPSNAEIAYAYRSALRVWDGSGFDTIPQETLRIRFGPLSGITTPPADPAEPIEGFSLGVSSSGEWHNHYDFRLELNGSPATGPESAGVYLVEIELRIDDPSIGSTEPFWLVFNNGADSGEFDTAIEVARNTVSTCGDTDCPADVNGDGAISDSDFFAWVTAFIASPATPETITACDVNRDGSCSDSDFFAWVTAFINNDCQ